MKIWWYAFKYHYPLLYYFLRGWAWFCLIPAIVISLFLIGWPVEVFWEHWSDFAATPGIWTLIFGLVGIGLLTCIILAALAFIFIGVPILIGEHNYRLDPAPINALIFNNRAAQKERAFQAWISKFQVHSDTEGFLFKIPETLVRELTQERYKEPFIIVKVLNPTPLMDGTREQFYIQVVPHNPSINTAKEAVAWTFYKTGNDYKPVQRA